MGLDKKKYAIGLMSGTSLDGLDMVSVAFWKEEKWHYKLLDSTTISFPPTLLNELKKAPLMSAYNLALLDRKYGKWIGNCVKKFHQRQPIKHDFVASHGQTIFHQPQQGITLQIGHGAEIAATSNLCTICDFRSTDIALQGEGAPLVPIGDQQLFGETDACVNIGGFANCSYNEGAKRIAFDISPANIMLNAEAEKLHLPYDDNGQLARSGTVDDTLLNVLNHLPFYQQQHPKSLGNEWLKEHFSPLLSNVQLSTKNMLCTLCEHIAIQIGKALPFSGKTLFTGGGTHNGYLMERIAFHLKSDVIIPKKELIDYKEAIIFGFLGTLRWYQLTNTLASATGALQNSSSGAIYLPPC